MALLLWSGRVLHKWQEMVWSSHSSSREKRVANDVLTCGHWPCPPPPTSCRLYLPLVTTCLRVEIPTLVCGSATRYGRVWRFSAICLPCCADCSTRPGLKSR